jgi:hypothetical protein
VASHHGMARLPVSDAEGGLQILRVAANILNTECKAADKEWSITFRVR